MFQTSDILARLDGLIAAAAQWGPAVPVAIVFAVALVEAVVLPWRYRAKAGWVLLVVLCGAGAITLARWEQQPDRIETAQRVTAVGVAADRAASETAALHGLWSQWDTLSKTLPPAPGDAPAASFDTLDDALASLSAKLASINDQIAALRTNPTGRAVDPATAVKLADHLRQYGSQRVVVSCAPSDAEAYAYANQLLDILKVAGWDANGPETTVNVVDEPAMGVTVLVRDPGAPAAAKILIDAFTQFDIPHQPGISADYAIPDTATVELFVAKKP